MSSLHMNSLYEYVPMKDVLTNRAYLAYLHAFFLILRLTGF